MLISLDSGELNKSISAMNNLFHLDKCERVSSRNIYKLIKEFLSQYTAMSDYQIIYFKDKIYGLFDNFTKKDGVNPEFWDLFAFFIEAVEIGCKKIKQVKTINEFEKSEKNNESSTSTSTSTSKVPLSDSDYYKKIVDIRLKQCRSYTVPEWEKDDKQIDLLLKGLDKLEKDLEKVDDLNFKDDKKIYLSTTRDKIEKIKKKKEYDKQFFK